MHRLMIGCLMLTAKLPEMVQPPKLTAVLPLVSAIAKTTPPKAWWVGGL